ncbi:hypothetical protein V8E36_006607 [Tilletia maclaganii]
MAQQQQQPLCFASTGIACIALISARNTPVYLRAFPHSPAAAAAAAAGASSHSDSSSIGALDLRHSTNVRYEYIANAALDLIDERTTRHTEHYLGLLMTMEDLAVYGFQTSSRVKILIMLPATDIFVRDIDVLTNFRAIHTAYLSYVANPFHLLPPIISPSSFASSSSSSSAGSTSKTAVFHPAPTSHFQPASIFSADPALEQVAALQAQGCRPIRSEGFESDIEDIVGWTLLQPQQQQSSATGAGAAGYSAGGGQGRIGPEAGSAPAVPVV